MYIATNSKSLLNMEKSVKQSVLEIPDVVKSMLGVLPSDSLDSDDINGRKAFNKHLEEKYK